MGRLIAFPVTVITPMETRRRRRRWGRSASTFTTVLGETYGYAPDNKRVYKRKSTGVEEVFYYGVGGQRLGVYTPKTTNGLLYFELTTTWQYFAGRRLEVMDRLGSVPTPGSRYYPYGEESNPPANNPSTIQAFVDKLEGTPGHMYNSKSPEDWKASIAGGRLSNGDTTIGTYQSLLNAFEKCDTKFPEDD
jgi:hypothetical protein